MTQNYTQDPNSIKSLVKKFEEKKLYLPEFQRDFTWDIERSVDLFDSIMRGIFIGALIESKPKFSLTCRELDCRPRKGTGSRQQLAEHNFAARHFENRDVYVLLDGQQRVTSLYRALKGIDDIFFVLKTPENLPDPDTKIEDLTEIVDCFTFKKIENRLCFTINQIYGSPTSQRENTFRKSVFNPEWDTVKELDGYQDFEERYFDYSLAIREHFHKLIEDKTLLSVFLLDMDLEKFCLFFERSNSRGVTLNFIDIITAKVYIDFKLRKEIRDAAEEYDFLSEKNPNKDAIVEAIVRYITFLEHGQVDKKTILKFTDGSHFQKHWSNVIKLFSDVHDFLEIQKMLIAPSWLNYQTMLIPIAHFLSKLPYQDFSQMTEPQSSYFRYWFYSSLINSRYGGGMAGSTNDVIAEDCKLLANLASSGVIDLAEINKFRVKIDKEDLLSLTGKGAAFNGLMCLLNYKSNFLNWSHPGVINTRGKTDIHHIFPKKYVAEKFGEESVENELVDSILNKTVIEKLPNQRFGSNAPSIYLNESPINDNESINEALKAHFIPKPTELLNGDYDGNFLQFLNDRFELFMKCIEDELMSFQNNKKS
jgi:hypothetical protein